MTNASTTQLYDIRAGDWARDLIGRAGLPAGLFPAHAAPGDLPAMRALLRATQPLRHLEPTGDPSAWAAAAARIGV